MIVRQLQRVHVIDGDVAAAQGQLRLLREELDLQAGQRNQRQCLSALDRHRAADAGNAGDGFLRDEHGRHMPFERGAAGTFLALLMALALSGATWLVLRLMGLVRR